MGRRNVMGASLVHGRPLGQMPAVIFMKAAMWEATLVALSVALVAVGGAAEVVTQDHLGLVLLLVGFVAGVAGLITWIDLRIRAQIREHNKLDRQRHRMQMMAIHHVWELVAVKLGEPLPPPMQPEPGDEDTSMS